MDFKVLIDFGIVVGGSILRSVAGWAQNALQDGNITRFEWKELSVTIVRVGFLGTLGYIGFSLTGIDNAALAGTVSAILVDKYFDKIFPSKK